MCALPTGQHEKRISSTSYSEEVFLSDTPPLSSPHLSGASVFVSSPLSSKLKHSSSTISPQGFKPHRSRGFSLVEESSQWAHKEVERLSPASSDHMNFYKRTRPTNNFRELSSPKKTGETFSKAKEQHHSPKLSESPTQEATVSRNGMPQKQARTQSTSPRMSPQVGQPVASTPPRSVHQQHPQRRLKDSSSRESLDHKKKNCKGGNPEIIRYTQGREMEGRSERVRPGLEQETFKRRVVVETQRTPLQTVREKDPGKGLGQRDADGKGSSPENNNTATQTINKRESLFSFKDLWSRTGSVVSPKEANGQEETFSFSKQSSSKEESVASMNSIPGAPQSPKGPMSPKPWKVPSSVKILSLAEALRDSL